MIEETVEVTFRLFIGSELELSEQEISASVDAHRSRLRARNRYDGAIAVSSPNNPIVQAEDELPAIVKNFCFDAIPDLASGKNVVIDYYDHYGNLRLNPEGLNVLICGSDIPTISVPCRELLSALYGCGQRFIQFLYLLKGDASDSELENLIHFLEAHDELARKTLVSMKLMPDERRI